MTCCAARSGQSIEMTVDLPPDFPPAQADANQVELALLNLAVNARDAMPEGGTLASPSIADDRRRRPRRGPLCAACRVRHRQGMDRRALRRAIEPFFSTKEVGKGTGLGLSMIHGLALQLKGALRLFSTPGQGTRAELWLPVADGAAEARPSSQRWRATVASGMRPFCWSMTIS